MIPLFGKKKAPAPADVRETAHGAAANAAAAQEALLDDVSFIQDMKHIPGTWQQYDVLLAARGYGWDYMVDSAAYMAAADLDAVSTLTVAEMANMPETELIEAYKTAGGSIRDFPPLASETGQLAIGGISRTLKVPVKLVWFNQTRVLRLFTWVGDETLVRKYIETVIRRTFGTKDAMKRARAGSRD